jgi:geranylgeranyl reductase family protein
VKAWDAIVVGAGPAGSTAAWRLATGGATVLLLDRARFPRDKPCGGAVVGRSRELVPVPLEPVVEDVTSVAELRFGYGRKLERTAARPLALMTQRLRLDQYLAEQAAEAGADFRDGVRVTGIEAGEDEVTVAVDGQRLRGRTLVGADGVNGVSARALGLGEIESYGVALEGSLPYEHIAAQRFQGRFVLELGVVPGGYGWVFPKGEHANFGIGGWESEGPSLRARLRRLCEVHGTSFAALENVRGYRLPVRSPDSRLARGQALVVGDAAGLVDPLSGDGMYGAFLSAKLASEAVADRLAGREASVEPYGPRVTERLAEDLRVSWALKLALERFPRSVFTLLRTNVLWRAVEKVLSGEVGGLGEAGGLAAPALRAAAVLAGRSRPPQGRSLT